MIETALIVGTWCLVSSYSNGYDLMEHRALPRTYIYERKADCDPGDQLVIGRRGLKDYINHAELSDDKTQLIIEGNILVKRKRRHEEGTYVIGKGKPPC
jgi:hypothetical protein